MTDVEYGAVDDGGNFKHDHSVHDGNNKESGFGLKTITFFGGFTLLVNNITGPGMVTIPTLYQQAGWVVPTLALLVVMVVSGLSATMLCEAMASVPGNEGFDDRIELTTLARYYFNKPAFMVTLVLFVLSLEAVNIAAIIVSAQTMDLTLVAIDATCGLQIYPDPGWVCYSTPGKEISPFGDVFVLSLGFLIVLAMSIPLGYFNLDDNIIVQEVAWGLFMLVCVLWLVYFIVVTGIDVASVPAVGKDMTQVLGTAIFNYAFVTTVPSWVNEKKPDVSVNKSMWWSLILSTALFVFMGLFGAWAFENLGLGGADFLDAINTHQAPAHLKWLQIAGQVTVYLFPLVTLVSGIPVFSIIIRYNLVEQGVNKVVANLIGVVLPWVVAVPFFTGNGLAEVINWTSLIVNGLVNFLVPLALFISSRRTTYLERRDMVARLALQQGGGSAQTEPADSPVLSVATASADSTSPLLLNDDGLRYTPAAAGKHQPHAHHTSDEPGFVAWPWKGGVIAAWVMIVGFSIGILAAIALNIMSAAHFSIIRHT